MPNTAYQALEHQDPVYHRSGSRFSMAVITRVLWVGIALLMIDSIIEMSFLSSMVRWLHVRAGKAFEVSYPEGSTFSLHGKPVTAHLILNQGHTSNGAAGTAFVLIGLGGILALWLRSRSNRYPNSRLTKLGMGWYHFWLIMTIPSTLLTLAALIYVFIVTYQHWGQTIDIQLASTLHNEPYPNYVAYPLQMWTPENWFTAVLKLPLTSSSDRSDIQEHLTIMKAWRWNLIPLLIIESAVCAIAFIEAMHRRRLAREEVAMGVYGRDGKRLSA